MGGYGSTRWGSHYTKTAVEDCRKLTMKVIHSHILKGGRSGNVNWSRGGERIASIGYRVVGYEEPESIRLIYTFTQRSKDEKRDFDYPVRLTTSPLPWGGHRFWFICPMRGCGRRVSVLYLPPRGDYFACRHCYRLSYRSRQEGHRDRAAFTHLAQMIQDKYPGITWRAMKEIFRK